MEPEQPLLEIIVIGVAVLAMVAVTAYGMWLWNY